MNAYQKEQLDALRMVRKGLAQLGPATVSQLKAAAEDYLRFRRQVDTFLQTHFSAVCTHTCFQNRASACCSKDGIITFFADTVVDALSATASQLDALEAVLDRSNTGHRCVYLTSTGCMWTVRPVVCAMFLCDRAMQSAFGQAPAVEQEWQRLRRQARSFKWPDRPVLFDHLEKVFLDMGLRSTLMHLNLSPGLLMVKKKAGLR